MDNRLKGGASEQRFREEALLSEKGTLFSLTMVEALRAMRDLTEAKASPVGRHYGHRLRRCP